MKRSHSPHLRSNSVLRASKSAYIALVATVDESRMSTLGIAYGTQTDTHRIVMSVNDWARARQAKAVELVGS